VKLGLFDHMQKNGKPEGTYADLYATHLETLEYAATTGKYISASVRSEKSPMSE